MRYLKLLGLLVGAFLALGCGDGRPAFPDHDGIPGNCEYKNGAYYNKYVMPRFDNNHHRLVLVDWRTRETLKVLATDMDAANTEVLSWSPDCHYFVTWQAGQANFYDVVSGAHLAHFDRARPYDYGGTAITWDATSSRVTVEAGNATYLLNLGAPAVKLTDGYFIRQYWDYARNQLVGVSKKEVASFDLNTGAKVATFGDIAGDFRLIFSPDDSHVALYSSDRYIYVFNRDTMARTNLNTGYYIPGSLTAFSPDNRYLVRAGWTITVWDLQDPPGDISRLEPMAQYNGPGAQVKSLQFIDGLTVETKGADGTYRWNILTGKAV